MSLLNIIKGEQPLLYTLFPGTGDKGEIGEHLTEFALAHGSIPGRYLVYTNLLVPKPDATSQITEVDVLMLHERGILVFESKNYSGWIFGSVDREDFGCRAQSCLTMSNSCTLIETNICSYWRAYEHTGTV